MTKRATEKPDLPSWFDEAAHRITPAGIVNAATGDLLDEDGRPRNRHAAARAGDTTNAIQEA